MTTVADLRQYLDQHVVLDLQSLDRIYLNAYVPSLQVGGQVVTFLTRYLGYPIPSPALFAHIGDRFRQQVRTFADRNHIPLVRFKKGQRKIDLMLPHLRAATGPGVVGIGLAQEFQSVMTGFNRATRHPGAVHFGFHKADRRVTVFYFYLLDPEFGPAFIKLCSYFPYPAKVWLNGHEWAKRQADAEGLAYTELANGFATCSDPQRLQAICDRLGPEQIRAFFDRWMEIIPTPLRPAERKYGYWWELAMRQIETSRTLTFDAPRRSRAFIEALITDNLCLGRPDQVQLIFARQVRKNTRGIFSTKVDSRGTEQMTINVFYRNSRIKEYLKEGRALRVEFVCNSAEDLGCRRGLEHLPLLQKKARAANDRLLTMQQAGQGCAIGTTLLERVQLPSIEEGQRTGALRFGDQRAMALVGALCVSLHAVNGFTNGSLRALVAGLLGTPYSAAQMTYDLRRLRLKGLINRLEHQHRYVLTPDGIRIALFYTKLHDRLLGPLLDPDQPAAPAELRRALQVVDRVVHEYVVNSRIAA